LVPDPDMTFTASKVLDDFIIPTTYQHMYNYNEGIFIDKVKWKVNSRIPNDQADLCGMRLNNIKKHQDI
jgi:hypothetical protein